MQYDSHGRVVKISTSSWASDYVYDQSGVSAFKTGGAWYYLDRNSRGDVIGVRNDAGALQASIRYTAYGDIWTDNQTLVDKLAMTFNGRDAVVSLGSGLYWMQHRVYSANQARFVASDPAEAIVGTTASAYNYADGDPVNGADPTGLHKWYNHGASGCGSPSLPSWIRNNLPYKDAFAMACRWHDQCYTYPFRYNSQYTNRRNCDSTFLSIAQGRCSYWRLGSRCYDYAGYYHLVIRSIAGGWFDPFPGAQAHGRQYGL